MSRSKFYRALLALGALLGAAPLMGQAKPAAAPFPYGTYTSTVAADDNHPTARTLTVELTSDAMKVYEAGELVSSYLINVEGSTFRLWRTAGPCTEPTLIQGSYRWVLTGEVLTFGVVADPCPGRAAKITQVRLVKAPAPAANAAAAFPFGKYALVATDTVNGPPPGMFVEFTPTSLNVIRGGQVVETHGMSVSNGVLETFTFGGDCTDPGRYRWLIQGKNLSLIVIEDPCTNRAMAIAAVTFVQQ